MTSASFGPQTLRSTHGVSIQGHIECTINDLLTSLPNPEHLSGNQRRGIIARYTAVLEGNFIYWMTAAFLSVKSEESRLIILDNLGEEVRDCHPGMMRRFAVAACAVTAPICPQSGRMGASAASISVRSKSLSISGS